MKGLASSIRRLTCCMSPELISEPADRVASPSSASTRPPSQSFARSQSPNETVPAPSQDTDPTATSLPHSSTMDDAKEQAPTCNFPDTPSTSKRTLSRAEREKSPKRTTETVLCSLERLPVEIQTRILVDTSLDSLRALLRSSPRFFYVYSQNRLPILRKVLSCALDGFFLDAYAACMSDRYFAAAAETWRHLSDEYLESPDTVPSAFTIDGLSLAITQKMAHFHLHVVEPLTERYCRWALGTLSSSPQAAPLTKTEKSRIQRAMYRLQVICNLGIGDPQTMLQVLDSFGPWAAEQIICVHEFAKERFMSAFIECAEELNEEENPTSRNSRVALLDVGEALLLRQYENLDVGNLYNILSLGLLVLQDTFQAEDLEELRGVIRENVESYGGNARDYEWINGAAILALSYKSNVLLGEREAELYTNGQCLVRHDRQFQRQFYSDHDELQDTQQEMLFEQDDLLSPPLAWVAFWDGRYSNQIGDYIPNALHRWGYVMWDAKRLKESGAMEYIELEWQCMYGIRGSIEDDDPRDYYITAYRQQLGNDD